jgi:hypothetical protein
MRAREGNIIGDRGHGGRRWSWNIPTATKLSYAMVIREDFDGVAHNTNGAVGTVVKDAGAAVAIVAGAVGGKLRITSTATTDNDGGSVQGPEIFKLAAGRDIWFETSIALSDADQMDFFGGFGLTFATNPENLLAVTDKIGFQIDDGNASILCKTTKNSTTTSTDSGVDAADGVAVKLGMRIIGTGTVEFYVNDALVATHTTNVVDDEELCLAFYSLSGDATGTKTCDIDYVYAAMTR